MNKYNYYFLKTDLVILGHKLEKCLDFGLPVYKMATPPPPETEEADC